MRRNTALIAVTLLILLTAAACRDFTIQRGRDASSPDLARELLVINEFAMSISIIDPADLSVSNGSDGGGLQLTGSAPNDLSADIANGLLYCVNSLSNSISIYDEDTMDLIDSIYLGVNVNPWAMALDDEDPSIGYVTGYQSQMLYQIDLDQRSILRTYDLSALESSSPEGLIVHEGAVIVCMTGFDQRTYEYGEGSLAVIDLDTGSILEKGLSFEGISAVNCQSLFYDESSDTVHVICTGVNSGDGTDDGKVFILDAEDLTVDQVLDIGGTPVVGKSSIDTVQGIVYLAGQGMVLSYALGDDSSDAHILHGSDDPLFLEDSDDAVYFGIAADTDNGRLFLSNFRDDAIEVYDLDDHELIDVLTVSDGPSKLLLHEEP